MNKKGFTLIELIAVIVILVIIMLIAIPRILNMVDNSKKDTLLSSAEMLAKAIQTDSLSSGKSKYELDTDGKLWRLDDNEEHLEQVPYKGKLVSANGYTSILVSGENGQVLLQRGTVCEKNSKFCFDNNGSQQNLLAVKKDDIKTGLKTAATSSTSLGSTTSSGIVAIASGDITKEGTSGSVTYTFYSNGNLVINGTGDAIMKDFTHEGEHIIDIINANSLQGIINSYLLPGVVLEQEVFEMFYYAYVFVEVRTVQGFISFIDQVDEEKTLEEITQIVNEMLPYYFGDNANNIFSLLETPTFETLQIIGVKKIGTYAFSNCQLTSLIIPNSVTTIGNRAFISNNLTSLIIPNSVTTIGSAAFSNNQISSLTIGTSVTTIEDGAFSYNLLTSVTIPNSVTNLSGFSNNQLTSVIIPNSVTTIGYLAFGNNQISNLTIGNNVTTIGDSAFYNNQITSLTIGNSVTSINTYAFSNNQISSLTIGNSVTTIGYAAFSNNQLTSVTIPASVNAISSMSFVNNPLTSVTILGSDPNRFDATWDSIGFPTK